MNRIQQPTRQTNDQKDAVPPCQFHIESALFSSSSEEGMRAVFAPVHYERKYAYPLIVWLHGARNDHTQLLRIMPEVSMRNYVAVAPRGFPAEGDGEAAGHDWPQNLRHIQEAQQRVFEAIAEARSRFHVAADRVFLAGFDCGGTMALRTALSFPERFAGVLSLSGCLPRNYTPFGRLEVARRLPVFLSVGRDSTVYSPTMACDDLRLLHTAGMSITLRQYPCGQELSVQVLRDVDRWIMEQVTTAPGGRSSCDDSWSLSTDEGPY